MGARHSSTTWSRSSFFAPWQVEQGSREISVYAAGVIMVASICTRSEDVMSEDLKVRQQGRRDFLKAGGAVAAALVAPVAVRGTVLEDSKKGLPPLPTNPVT